jgi:hypothetical protein
VPDRVGKPARERFLVTLETKPSAIAPMVRIRGALKVLGRRFQLRCVRVERTPPKCDAPTSAPSSAPIVSPAGSGATTSALQPVLPTKTRRRRTIGLNVAPPGRLTCDRCGRSELRERHGKVYFHFALCGLPCSAGPIPAEERREHAPTHPENCSCA